MQTTHGLKRDIFFQYNEYYEQLLVAENLATIKVMLALMEVFESKLRRYDTNCTQCKQKHMHYLALNFCISIREYCTP